jgi:hypothetical protein
MQEIQQAMAREKKGPRIACIPKGVQRHEEATYLNDLGLFGDLLLA